MTCPSRIALLFVAFSLACATAAMPPSSAPTATPAAPPTLAVATVAALDPVGTFDFVAGAPDGSTWKGIIVVTGSPGAYAGRVERDGFGSTDLTSITVGGQTLTTNASLPEGTIVTTVTFAGDEFSGKWALSGFEGTISGRRRLP